MNTRLFFIGAFIFSIGLSHSSCAQNKYERETHKRIDREYNLQDFVKIESETVANIQFTQSPNFSVRAEGDERIVENLQVSVTNGTLRIAHPKNFFKRFRNNRSKMTLFVSSPDLQEINSDGVGNITLQGDVTLNNLIIDSDGVGNINAENLVCNALEIESDGVGNINLKGRAQSEKINSDGVGNIKLEEMPAHNVWVESDGVGNVKVHATDSIRISANGVGDVIYYGNPQAKEIRKNGIGKVKSGE